MALSNLVRIILAVFLLLCLAPMPYGYYQLIRVVGLVGFGFLALKAQEKGDERGLLFFIFSAVLFNPFFPIGLGRMLWNIVDVIWAIVLLFPLARRRSG